MWNEDRAFHHKMARVVVFGAAGQVGVSLVETALKDGYQVTAFIKKTPLPEHLTDKVIRSFAWIMHFTIDSGLAKDSKELQK